MRALLDTNVLFPTVQREVLLAAARAGFYRPLWSERILKEWELAAARLGPVQAEIAKGEIALLRAAFPDAVVTPTERTQSALWLPDPSDIHVLAAAIDGSADVLVTQNARDFPRQALRFEGVERVDPDGFLMRFWSEDETRLAGAVAKVHAEAERLSGDVIPIRALLKRARLPRLGKAIGA